jgi:hypothetical protein
LRSDRHSIQSLLTQHAHIPHARFSRATKIRCPCCYSHHTPNISICLLTYYFNRKLTCDKIIKWYPSVDKDEESDYPIVLFFPKENKHVERNIQFSAFSDAQRRLNLLKKHHNRNYWNHLLQEKFGGNSEFLWNGWWMDIHTLYWKWPKK